ncbi:MAG: amidase domain-containing protein [Myxococcales bacterium]|nr:amidase domain-containing protein [Myxococcales bacterium]
MRKFIVTVPLAALLMCITIGCGQSQNQHSATASDSMQILANYTENKLHILAQGDLLAVDKLPSPVSQRISWLIKHNKNRGIQIVDYGLRLSVLSVKPRQDSEEIIISEEITLKTTEDELISFSYEKEYHEILMRSDVIYSDTEVNIDHPDFDNVLQMSEQSSKVVRFLPDNPYGRKAQSQSHTNSPQMPTSVDTPLYLIASAVKKYAEDHCETGTYNSPPYHIYAQDCANFVSQCLLAGGLSQIDNSAKTDKARYEQARYWWFNNGTTYPSSLSWRVADGLGNHLYDRYGSSPTVHWVWEDAHVGDVIVIDRNHDGIWDHTMIVTTAERSSSGAFVLKASGHTNDRCDKDFYALAGSYGWWIQIIHVS